MREEYEELKLENTNLSQQYEEQYRLVIAKNVEIQELQSRLQ